MHKPVVVTMSRQVFTLWQPHVLTRLQQGSTLSIRSQVKNTHLSIRSRWRDDGFVSFLQHTVRKNEVSKLLVSQQDALKTSIGREESHFLLEVKEAYEGPTQVSEKSAFGDDEARLVLEDGFVVEDSSSYQSTPGLTRFPISENMTFLAKESLCAHLSAHTALAVEVPEKVNIDCDLSEGGSITIHNKVEGDVRLRTKNGDIRVNKLRGHSIDIEIPTESNSLYASDLLEAESLRVRLRGRLRAKRIHASSCSVEISSQTQALGGSSKDVSSETFDSDDAGALCDISSLYLTGDATINVGDSNGLLQPIRIKSIHGHINVNVQTPSAPMAVSEMTGEPMPVVDLGGVNGSCEVFVGKDQSSTEMLGDVSCRIHFDSVAPDSVSVIQAQTGDIHLTMDRKVETDLRMLSATDISHVEVDSLLLDEDDEEIDEQIDMLRKVNESSSKRTDDVIQINTRAYTPKDNTILEDYENLSAKDGWLENKSDEPDSRFDRKLRNEVGSVGKIRLDGAANQALQGFQGSKDSEQSSFIRPMVAVVGTEGIIVETLSWLGNIARRYGLDDKRDTEELGRTATRRGRSLTPAQSE